MSEEELIKALKEMDKKRVEQLNDNARNLFNAIMDIANQRDRLLEEKQNLINYIKKQINDFRVYGNNEDYNKLYGYEDILFKIEKSDK